jgi:hypothetical protein
MSTENKEYKFKFEYTTTDHFEDEHGHGDVDTTFVTCGSTAEEAIKGHKELMEEWEKFLEKEAKGPYRDRRKLK